MANLSALRFSVSVLLALAGSIQVQGAGFTIAPKKVTAAPTIDGVLDDDCWVGVKALTGFTKTTENYPAEVQTRVRMVYDDEALYLAFDCDEPNPSRMQAPATSRKGLWRSDPARQNDLVDVFLVPEEGHLYQFAVTSAGLKFDQHRFRGTKTEPNFTYGKDCPVAVKIGETNWICEMKLPFKALKIKPQMAATWGVNFTRVRPQDRVVYSSWAETSGKWKDVKSFGSLEGLIIGEGSLADKPPLKLMKVSLGEFSMGKNLMTVKLKSRKTSGRFRVRVSTQSPTGKISETSKVIEVKWKGADEYMIPYKPAMESGVHKIIIRLADVEPDKVFYESPPARLKIPGFLQAYCDRNYYTREKDCWINVRIPDVLKGELKGKKLRLVLKDEGGKKILDSEKNDPTLIERIPLRIGRVPPGSYVAEVVLEDENGKAMSTLPVRIEKHRPALNEVKIDREREIFLVNNEPFYQYGWWFFKARNIEAAFKQIREHNFNYVTLWAHQVKGLEAIKDFLDLAHKYDIKVIVSFDMFQTMYREICISLSGDLMTRRLKIRDIPLTKMEFFELCLAEFEKAVPEVRDHPALLAYKSFDEPNDTESDRVGLRRIREIVRKLDPYHPVVLGAITGQGVEIVASEYNYDEYFTQVMKSGYFAPAKRGMGDVNSICYYLDRARWDVRDMHIPIKANLRSAAGGGYGVRELTPSERRAQVYLAMTHQVSGINYFVYVDYGMPMHRANWKEHARLGEEVRALTPILAGGKPEQRILVHPKYSSIHSLLRTHDDKLYLILVNSNVVTQKLTFEGNFIGAKTRVKEFFKGTSLPCKDFRFTDTVRHMDSRVYEISAWKTDPGQALNLKITATKLEETYDVEDVKRFFASDPHADYIASQNRINVNGPGNTLESIARDIGNEKIFTYDKQERKASTSVNAIWINYGGELVIGDEKDPSRGETLDFAAVDGSNEANICANGGTLKVHHSTLDGAGSDSNGAIRTRRIGRIILVDTKLKNWNKATHYKALMKKGEVSEDGGLTVSIYGEATKPGDRFYSKGVHDLVDWVQESK